MGVIDLKYIPIKTRKVFEKLSETDFIRNYTLVGGTALSIQIQHRLSEDLDFIFDGDKLNINTIKRNLNKIFCDYRIIRQENNDQIDIVIGETKLTFFTTEAVTIPFSVKANSFLYKNLNIANIEVIASLKMATISQRNTIRDYYDLYFISKYHIDLKKIIDNTKKFFPNLSPITYSETLIYTNDIQENDLSNHLSPKEEVTKQDISDFFILELKKIINVL